MQRGFRSTRLLSLSLFIVSLVSLLPRLGGVNVSQAKAQSGQSIVQGRTRPLAVERPHAFINYRDDGAVGCREATEDEAIVLKRRTGQSLHDISSGRASRNPQLSAESAGLQIILRATDQLENFPEAKAAFLNAAARWEAVIQTPITVVIDVDFGPTWFGEKYDTNVLGQTDSQDLGDSSIYGEVRNALVGLGLGDERTGIYNQLPLASVPTNIGSTSNVITPSAVWRMLGFIDPVANPDAEQRELGDPPATGFNSAFSYDFDPSDGIDSNKIDFDASPCMSWGIC